MTCEAEKQHTVMCGGKSSDTGEWGAVTLADEAITLVVEAVTLAV